MSRRQQEVNDRHIDSVIETKLFPGRLQAGRVTDIQVEAMARSEVQTTHIRLAGESSGYFYDETNEESEVYLLTSGKLFSGRPLGYTACLTVVAATWISPVSGPTGVAPRYMGVAFKTNDLLAQSGLDESRAIRTYIDVWGLANPQVQNVRRGKDPHSKG